MKKTTQKKISNPEPLIKETAIERLGKRGVQLEATVNGKTLWRVWFEGSTSTLAKKRKLLIRDIELEKKK